MIIQTNPELFSVLAGLASQLCSSRKVCGSHPLPSLYEHGIVLAIDFQCCVKYFSLLDFMQGRIL